MSDEQPATPPTDETSGWVQVPVNPYGSEQHNTPGGKLFATLAMSFGLAALLTVVVAVAYSRALAWVAVVFGLAAVVFGVIALVLRQHPRAGSIVGVTGGGLSVLSGLAVTGVVFSALFAPAGAEPTGMTDEITSEWTPDQAPEALIEWPRNMASGGVVFAGPGAPVARSSEQPAAGTAPSPSAVNRDTTTDVLIFVDYQCPHCASFEQTNGEFLERVIAEGNTTVEVVPLAFLDRLDNTSYYSSRAAATLACVADAQPQAAFDTHRALLSPAMKPQSNAGLSNDEILAGLKSAGVTLEQGTQECIQSERFVGFVQALNQWAFANPVPNALDQEARLQGTPSVFVNGNFYTGKNDNSAEFEAFFAEFAATS